MKKILLTDQVGLSTKDQDSSLPSDCNCADMGMSHLFFLPFLVFWDTVGLGIFWDIYLHNITGPNSQETVYTEAVVLCVCVNFIF